MMLKALTILVFVSACLLKGADLKFSFLSMGGKSLREPEVAVLVFSDHSIDVYDFQAKWKYSSRSTDLYEYALNAFGEVYRSGTSEESEDEFEDQASPSDDGDFVKFYRLTFHSEGGFDSWDIPVTESETLVAPKSQIMGLVKDCFRIASRVESYSDVARSSITDREATAEAIRSITKSLDLAENFETMKLREELATATSVVLETRENGWRTSFHYDSKEMRLDLRAPRGKWRRDVIVDTPKEVKEFIDLITINPERAKRRRLVSLFDGPSTLIFMDGTKRVFSISFYRTFTLPRLEPSSMEAMLDLLKRYGREMEYYE